MILVRFVTHGERPEYHYAAMEECPRRGEFVDLEDGMRRFVKWVRWRPMAVEPSRFDPDIITFHHVSVELEKGIPT